MRRHATQAGFTFFELMIVVSIITLLLGIGVTVLSRLSYRWGFEASVMRVQAVIRGARNFSLTNEAPSEVHVIPRENTIYAIGEKTVAQWHLEDAAGGETTGAFGVSSQVVNAYPVNGKTGSGLEFGTGEGLKVADSYVDCGNLPIFTPPAGIVIDVWVYPGDFRGNVYKKLIGRAADNYEEAEPDEEELEEQARRRAQNEITLKQKYEGEQRFSIVYKEDSYFLSLTENYALEFGFVSPASYFPFRTADNIVTPNTWNHVVLRYSASVDYPPEALKIFVNNVPLTVLFITRRMRRLEPIAKLPARDREGMLPKRLSESDRNLYISDPKESFYGKMDEVRIAAIVEPEVQKLDAAYLMGYPQVIYFDACGRLDPQHHEGDMIVKLTENPLYRAPEPEGEVTEYVSKSPSYTPDSKPVDAPVVGAPKTTLPEDSEEKYRYAVVTVNKYGFLKLTQVVEKETQDE